MNTPEVETLDLLSCQILNGKGSLENLEEWLAPSGGQRPRVFLLTDENTHLHGLPIIERYLPETFREFTIPPGEKSKSIGNAEKIWKWLIENGAERDDILLNLGGGVVTDLGGFAASAFKRGMPYVNIPTSLMGMVDASIGGKTSVNLSMAKNQVGTFYHPKAVFIDPVFLDTLPADHLRSGYAEILKSALLSGEAEWKVATSTAWDKVTDWMPLVRATLRMKAMIVARDPKDTGLRKILNLGHTLGHAFESCSMELHPPGMLHGDAVASGIRGELFISWRKGHICWSEMVDINAFLKNIFSKVPIHPDDKGILLDTVLKDKKNSGGTIRISSLKKIGEPLRDLECDQETIIRALDYLVKD